MTATNRASTAEQDLAGRKVLVIEDEPLISMMIEDMLDDLGCLVAGTAHNMEQALDRAENATIDLALLDMNLNGVVSMPVADRLAARRVPFVFATGYGLYSERGAYADVPVLQKPFGQEDLARALIDALATVLPVRQ